MTVAASKTPGKNPPKAILQLLRAKLGSNLGWRVNPEALAGEERAAAGDECQEVQQQRQAANEAVEKRRRELLQDPEYLRLRADAKRLDEVHARALGRFHARRVSVGVCGSVFFEIKAEADSWEEVAEKLEAKTG